MAHIYDKYLSTSDNLIMCSAPLLLIALICNCHANNVIYDKNLSIFYNLIMYCALSLIHTLCINFEHNDMHFDIYVPKKLKYHHFDEYINNQLINGLLNTIPQ